MAKAESKSLPWVVDTCMVIDVLEDDPAFGAISAELLDDHSAEGLAICPVTYAELAPAFAGRSDLQDTFLHGAGIDFRREWLWADTLRAHEAWFEHIRRRRSGKGPKRPLADILIGSWSLRFRGILTRNPADFRAPFPELVIRTPKP